MRKGYNHFVGKPERKRQHISPNGRITLEWVFGKLGVDWLHLAQDRDKWHALVNMIMNFWVP
jgi:hypothetical protein